MLGKHKSKSHSGCVGMSDTVAPARRSSLNDATEPNWSVFTVTLSISPTRTTFGGLSQSGLMSLGKFGVLSPEASCASMSAASADMSNGSVVCSQGRCSARVNRFPRIQKALVVVWKL